MIWKKPGPLHVVLGVVVAVGGVSLLGDLGAQNTVGGEVPPQVDVSIDSTSDLSGREKVEWVESQIGVARSIYQRVQNMLDRARKEKDTLKITCLDDKLTQIHVNLRGIEERQAALETAVAAGDKSSADQQFTILKIYISRIQGLMAEAENCIGDTDVVIGESETIVEIDEDVSIEDPTGVDDVNIGIEQPPHASAFY